jgi:hypothetical protein
VSPHSSRVQQRIQKDIDRIKKGWDEQVRVKLQMERGITLNSASVKEMPTISKSKERKVKNVTPSLKQSKSLPVDLNKEPNKMKKTLKV